MTRFQQDNRGRYVRASEAPQTERSRPNFPPRLTIPSDTRHPIRLVEFERWGARPDACAVRA